PGSSSSRRSRPASSASRSRTRSPRTWASPGRSRSCSRCSPASCGSSTAGRLFRLDRDAAARLSFLLLVPTVLGAVLLKGFQDVVLGDLPAGWKGPFLVGVLSAWGTGLLAIEWLL